MIYFLNHKKVQIVLLYKKTPTKAAYYITWKYQENFISSSKGNILTRSNLNDMFNHFHILRPSTIL